MKYQQCTYDSRICPCHFHNLCGCPTASCLLSIYCILYIAYCLLYISYCLLYVAYYSIWNINSVLTTVVFVLTIFTMPTVYNQLYFVYCLLFTVYCPRTITFEISTDCTYNSCIHPCHFPQSLWQSYCLLSIYSILYIAYCLLYIAYCILYIAYYSIWNINSVLTTVVFVLAIFTIFVVVPMPTV